MYFIDTHVHIYSEYYPDDLVEVVGRAIAADVTKMVIPCVSSANVVDIFAAVDQYPDHLFPLIGLHPTDVKKENWLDELTLLEPHLSDPRVVGVGECGLDLYWDKTTLPEQQHVFRKHLEWARDFQLPLSIHVRNAYAETFKMIEEFKRDHITGVMHCFSGGVQEAKWAVRNGFYLGVGGVVTFKNNTLQEIIKETGLQTVVLETDAPFLAPVPFRGKRNESAYIPLIAAKVAEIFDISVEEVMQVTTENALKVFKRMVV